MKTELMGDKETQSSQRSHKKPLSTRHTDSLTLAVRFSCRSRLLFAQVCFRTHVWVLTFLLAKVHRVLFGLPLDYNSRWYLLGLDLDSRVHWAMSWHHGAGSSQEENQCHGRWTLQTTPLETLLAYHPSTTYVCPYPCRRPLGSQIIINTYSFMLQILQDLRVFNPPFK